VAVKELKFIEQNTIVKAHCSLKRYQKLLSQSNTVASDCFYVV